MTVLSSFVIQALLAGSGVVVARMLGVEDRGNFAFLVLIPVLLVQIGGLGLPTAATYYLANGECDSRKVLGAVRGPAIGLTILLIPVQFILIRLLFEGDAPLAEVTTLMAIPGIFASTIGLAFLQGLSEFRLFNSIRLLSVAVYAMPMLVLLCVGERDLGVVASVWAAGVLVAGLISLVVGTRAVRSHDRAGDQAVTSRQMLAFGLKGLLGSSYPVDTFQLDQAAVGLFMSPSVLGLYVVAVAFTNLPRFVGQSVGIVAYPTVANSSEADGRKLLERFVLMTAALSLIIVAALELTAGLLVPFFFGQEFEGAVPLMRILVVAAALTAVRRVLTEGARGRGRPELGSIAELVAWVVLLPALAVFGAAWGANGIAFAMVVSSLAGLLAITIGTTTPKNRKRQVVAPDPPLPVSEEHP